MFFNINKRKIALFVLFFFLFSFPIKVQESYANPVALEVVLWGAAAVLTAAGIMVDTGDTDSLIYAVEEYWYSLKEPERKMYETMAIQAKEQGNAPLSDYLWSRANTYVNEKYVSGTNNIILENIDTPGILNVPYISISGYSLYVVYGEYYQRWYVNLLKPDGNFINLTTGWSNYNDALYCLNNSYFCLKESLPSGNIYIELYYIELDGSYKNKYIDQYDSGSCSTGSDEYNINFMSISPEEFNYSTPVPPGTVPERRIAYPSHVFNPNNDIDGILEPLTGKTAQDIWGAAGAYTANTTTFDPVSGDNPILPWVPIADPSTFTPAGELPAEISATAPGVLDGTNSDLNSISGSLGSIWDILKTGFNALIDTIWTGISHLLDGLGSISLLLKSVFDLINSGISALVGAISSIWDLVYDGFSSVAVALRGILDQVANVAGYLNPASDTFFLRTALVPDVAVLNGFVESLNINFQEKFQITAAYEEFQSYKDTDHESEFEDIYVDLPIWGMQCICKGEFVNTAGQQFKSVVAAFLIMLTVIFCFKRIATIGSK